MLIHILLSIVVVTVAGLAFAWTSMKLGRGDKRVGCGAGRCGACNPENKGESCPEEKNESNSFLDAMPHNRMETENTDDTEK